MTEKKFDAILETYKQFIFEFSKETDRAAVILGVAKLDIALRDLLGKVLKTNTGTTDELFDNEGPLSTFSAKINLAFRLGLLDEDFVYSLKLIKKIRNDFAHEVHSGKLSGSGHQDRIKLLLLKFNETKDNFDNFIKILFGETEMDIAKQFKAILGVLIARIEKTDKFKPIYQLNQPLSMVPELWLEDAKRKKLC